MPTIVPYDCSTHAYPRFDADRDGWVQMNYEQFMTVRFSSLPRLTLDSRFPYLDGPECSLILCNTALTYYVLMKLDPDHTWK
jgi:hypothetical protein